MQPLNSKTIPSSGFTLVELMITIAIAMILLLVGVPSMSQFIEESRQTSTQDLLIDAVHRAQQEAMSHNLSTYICPTSDGTKCETEWKAGKGWLIYVDNNRKNNFDSGDTIVTTQTTISAKTIKSSNTNIRFFPTGYTDQDTVQLDICSNISNVESRRINITRIGRVQHELPTTSSCPA